MRHSLDCCCDVCYRENNPEAREAYEQKQREEQKDLREQLKNLERINRLLKELGFPVNEGLHAIDNVDLYWILMDDEKCEALITKLKNKAFW